MSMECPYCQSENRPGSRYCNNCGRALPPPSAGNGAGGNVPDITSLKPGARLQGGRYVVKKVLGHGGMGTALLASDNRVAGKQVVIKELLSEQGDPVKQQEDVKNFRREVALLAHIDHPLVPNVTDHFEEGKHYFMVQEYVEGEDLDQYLLRTGQPMDEAEALTIASEILDVLVYLSQQTSPVVHRDIKPANIIIGAKDHRAHLVDFGIARVDTLRNAQQQQTSALGTPGYAPPEQYQGHADPRSDLYALAATLHHLLTNRDPRNYPPFDYPPVRSLNPGLSLEIENVLEHALNYDVKRRYQSAQVMKQAIDTILFTHFGISGSVSTYSLGSMPMPAMKAPPATPFMGVPPQQGAPQNVAPQKAAQAGGFGQANLGRPAVGVRAQGTPPGKVPGKFLPPPPPRRNNLMRNIVLLIAVILLILAAGAYALIRGFSSNANTANSKTPTATATTTKLTPTIPNGIGVFKAANGEMLGVSDGSFVFDSTLPDGSLKQQAAERLRTGDISGAESLWSNATTLVTNDAEALIYQEDQKVLSSGSPYVTLVIGTMLTGDVVGIGRDDLQGAYVSQLEYNSQNKLPGGVLVRLLIANSGSTATDAALVAQQIVHLTHQDTTVAGVMGWPYSSRALDVVSILSAEHIPMVSQTASSDLLTRASPYFFRVVPSNKMQGIIGAKYAEQKLKASKVALFDDPSDSYSSSLANDFKQQFIADGNTIVAEEHYTVGKPATLPQSLQAALLAKPDLIYFSGYASDVSTLLINLPTTGADADMQILGGDALYELSGYPAGAGAGFSRLHFTTFAYPDEWGFTSQKNNPPTFFANYALDFDPLHQHKASPYGYTRPTNDAILSYDALNTLLTGCGRVLSTNKTYVVREDLRQALAGITGAQAIQGVSGRIAFDQNGDPIDKALVILVVSPQGYIQLESLQGHFLLP